MTFDYDDKSQLVGYGINGNENRVSYDEYGNISAKDGIPYVYGVGKDQDRLLARGNESFEYDATGNPIVYRGEKLTWQGKKLASYGDVTYSYDQSGVRIAQTANGVSYKYYTEGKKVIFEKFDDNIITYLYDGTNIIGFKYDGVTYLYSKNAQNDIVGIFDADGDLVVEYLYDPWGKILKISGDLADTVGRINPYRYRSYRYDEATSLYYLNSRYYDPEVGRFLNADDVINLTYTILGDDLTKNLYTYCNNNPFNMSDPDGTMAIATLNLLRIMYADIRMLPDSCISTPALIANGFTLTKRSTK